MSGSHQRQDAYLARQAARILADEDRARAANRAGWLLSRLDVRRTRVFLELLGARVGSDCHIDCMLRVHNNDPGFAHLRIGDHCHLGKEVFLDLRRPITIGSHVTISMRTTIITHFSVGEIPLRSRFPRAEGEVRIEDDVYIGAGAMILNGVTIGSHSLVAAGAVVNRNVEPDSVVAGVPARLIRRLHASAEPG